MYLDTCQQLQLPPEFSQQVIRLKTLLDSSSEASDLLQQACQDFYTPEGSLYEKLLEAIAGELGIHFYEAALLLLLEATESLPAVYQKNGLPEDIMWEILVDIRCKIQECHDWFGIWGISNITWFPWFYTCKRFKLGRLEYEAIPYDGPELEGVLRKGDKILNIHIPSEGPMKPEAVLDSFRRAYRFYRKEFDGDIIPIVGYSWLLYPPMYHEVFQPKSNLRAFYELFHIWDALADPDNRDFARIFACRYAPGILDTAPADTSLRRNLLSFLRAGNSMGHARGIILFNGENIVPIP